MRDRLHITNQILVGVRSSDLKLDPVTRVYIEPLARCGCAVDVSMLISGDLINESYDVLYLTGERFWFRITPYREEGPLTPIKP